MPDVANRSVFLKRTLEMDLFLRSKNSRDHNFTVHCGIKLWQDLYDIQTE